LFLFLILSVLYEVCPAKIIYVDDDAAGTNNGTSWADAYRYLQDALADAKSADQPVEIRVAAGVYTPDKGAGITHGDIYATFSLINGVTISGGYAGINSPDPNARDFELYETILSGDLLGNDVELADPCDLLSDITRLDNSYNVVTAQFTDSTSRLDGLTITAGFANDTYLNLQPQSRGGGLYISQAEPVITNCTFKNNAGFDGGAIYIDYGNPTLTNCHFSSNFTVSESESPAIGNISGFGDSGGAIHNSGGSPVLTNCTFIGNKSKTGAGMYNASDRNLSEKPPASPTLTNCVFIANQAKKDGGGMSNLYCRPFLAHCTFEENIAREGGAIYNSQSTLVLTDCDFNSNQASFKGGGIFSIRGKSNITSCFFSGNQADTEGGGMYNDSNTDSVITDCVFTGNASLSGGGIYNTQEVNSVLIKCTFTANLSLEGGAMQNLSSNLSLTHCIFSGNWAAFNGGTLFNIQDSLKISNSTFAGNSSDLAEDTIFFTSGNDLLPSDAEFVNCILYDNENSIGNDDYSKVVITYSNIQGGWEGTGNFDEDPLFAEPGYWAYINDPNIVVGPDFLGVDVIWHDGDYHLKSQAGRYDPNSQGWIFDEVTSPCIDSGDPDSPVGNEPHPNGGRINIGAYGGTAEASMSLADSNNAVHGTPDGEAILLQEHQKKFLTSRPKKP
jgi:hypothetical protein